MAYDKVVNSAELEAGLTAVANAIRDKTGETESLVFPGGFVAAISGIMSGAVRGEVHDITVESNVSDTGTGLLTGNKFVEENYLKDGFMAILLAAEPIGLELAVMYSIIHGNLNIGATKDSGFYGCVVYGRGSNVGIKSISTKLSVNPGGTSNRFVCDGEGLMIFAPSDKYLMAGDYKLILLCADI